MTTATTEPKPHCRRADGTCESFCNACSDAKRRGVDALGPVVVIPHAELQQLHRQVRELKGQAMLATLRLRRLAGEEYSACADASADVLDAVGSVGRRMHTMAVRQSAINQAGEEFAARISSPRLLQRWRGALARAGAVPTRDTMGVFELDDGSAKYWIAANSIAEAMSEFLRGGENTWPIPEDVDSVTIERVDDSACVRLRVTEPDGTEISMAQALVQAQKIPALLACSEWP